MLAVPGPRPLLGLVEVDGVVAFGWVTEAVEVPFTVFGLDELRTIAISTTATTASAPSAPARWAMTRDLRVRLRGGAGAGLRSRGGLGRLRCSPSKLICAARRYTWLPTAPPAADVRRTATV